MMDRERRSVMLRFRFDDPAQLLRHLHVVDNQGLIFLRDHRDDVHYQRVLLELAVRATQQQAVVRGEVLARASGRLRGVWLRVSDWQVVRRLCECAAFIPRRQPRASADGMVRLRRPSGEQVVGQLLDLGAGGLRVRGVRGLQQGEPCDVHVVGGPVVTSDLGAAQVVRLEGQDAGFRFVAAESAVVARLVASLRHAWQLALEMDHVPECCADGLPIEPSMPDVRRQFAIAR